MKISTLLLFILSIILLLPILGLIKLLYNSSVLQKLVDLGFISTSQDAMKYILISIVILSILECLLLLILSIKAMSGIFKSNDKNT